MKKNNDIKIAIVVAEYRPEITENLKKYCVAALKKNGVMDERIDIFKVPGALEIPLACKRLAKKKIYGAIIVFGAVFKGATYHFEQVSNECVSGCMRVEYEYEVPIIFEVLSVYDPADAFERSSGSEDNRGTEGALSALKMIELMKKI